MESQLSLADPRLAVRPSRAATALLVCAALAGLPGCMAYVDRTRAGVEAFEAGRFEEAREELESEAEEGFLRGAETGMAALAGGEWAAAQERFDEAARAVKDIEERALLGPTELGEELASAVLNESFEDYSGEGYERVQLRASLALTYLARGNLDGLYVEARRANKLLETEEALYEKQYKAGGLGHFVSALGYELDRKLDEAYIDYKRMHEKGVGLELAGKALVRIASQLRYDDELPELRERYGDPPQIPPDSAAIVVLAGVGLGPYKVENTVGLMTPHGLAQFSVPSFVARPQLVSALELRVDDGAPLVTSVLEDVGVVSKENLDDRMAWLAARSAIRAAGKLIITDVGARYAEKEYGAAAGVGAWIAGSLFTAATERADTRAWQTLPNTWQAARLFVAPGSHSIHLSASGGEERDLGTFTLERGETIIVLARTLGTRLFAYPVGGTREEAPPAAPQTPPEAAPEARP